MTIAAWCRMAEQRLAAVGIPSPASEARLLAGQALGKETTYILAHPDDAMTEDAADALLRRREHHEPLAYITGRREFFGRTFRVGPGVLIPRHETETLVETALSLPLPPDAKVLDSGVGSGCIAVTLALERPQWRVSGVDISTVALAYAGENAARLGAPVDLYLADLLPPNLTTEEAFDLIVSNPPYIGVDESLPDEVREFEPAQALFAEEGGLAFYRRLASEAPARLSDGGWLAVEVGHTQAEAVVEIFRTHGWQSGPAVPDLAEIARVVTARRV